MKREGAGRRRDGAARDGAGGANKIKTMPLTKIAEEILEVFRRVHEREPKQSDLKGPEGALVGTEVIDYPLAYRGKIRMLYMPRSLLDTSPDFQLGCVYGMLMQRLRPKMMACCDCGKVREPVYGFTAGAIYDVVEKGCRTD